jgi:Big-like domain-containing protein
MSHTITRTLRVQSASVLALVAGLSACGGSGGGGGGSSITPPPSTPVLTTVSVSLDAPTLQVGWIDSARVAGVDQRGAPFAVGTPVWSTASSDIATVDANGLVEGIVIGQTTLIATVSGKQGRMTLNVVPVAVATVLVDPPADSLSPGQTAQFAATTLDGVGDTLTGRAVQWSSTVPNVATVSATGLVTAVSPGIAVVEATSEAAGGAAGVIVTGAIAPGVTIAIATPIRDQVVSDTLPIHAVAYSAYPISGMVASVGSQQLTLTPLGRGGWGGRMLLAGTYYGTFQLVLTATDERNAIGIDSMEFVRKKIVLGGNGPAPGKKQLVPVVPVKIP